jgi:hypothetical protein
MTGWMPGELVATDAQTAHDYAGACVLCERAMLRGNRVAWLADGRGYGHLGCISAMPAPARLT